MTIRRTGKRQSIKAEVIRWITAQGLKPGDQISSQNVLAEQFGTTSVTVHKALTELSREGVLKRRRGVGTFVRRVPEQAVAKTVKDACLLMPQQNLDNPTRNPGFWPYVRDLMAAFARACSPGWSFTVVPLAPGLSIEDLGRFDALFIHYTPEIPQDFTRRLIDWKRVPVVRLGRLREGPSFDCLAIDHDAVTGSQRGVSFLLQNGYRRIAAVMSEADWGGLHLQGYKAGLESFSIPYNEDLVVRVSDDSWECARAISKLESQKVAYDAIVTDGDLRALGVIDALRRNGRRVPEDVAVMGYDGLDFARLYPPYLTTVAAPWTDVIRMALQEIAAQPGKPTQRRQIQVAGEVLPGSTTGQRKGQPA